MGYRSELYKLITEETPNDSFYFGRVEYVVPLLFHVIMLKSNYVVLH